MGEKGLKTAWNLRQSVREQGVIGTRFLGPGGVDKNALEKQWRGANRRERMKSVNERRKDYQKKGEKVSRPGQSPKLSCVGGTKRGESGPRKKTFRLGAGKKKRERSTAKGRDDWMGAEFKREDRKTRPN